jgi:hypothetical protein
MEFGWGYLCHVAIVIRQTSYQAWADNAQSLVTRPSRGWELGYIVVFPDGEVEYLPDPALEWSRAS